MLHVVIPGEELWDGERGIFVYTKEYRLKLEHSLVSISKWESKWHKPYLSKQDKTVEEMIDYIKCMTITRNVPNEAYEHLTAENMAEIDAYMEDPMTATWFSENSDSNKSNQKPITSELIYFWMTTLNIPFQCEKWHLNRLMTLIRVCNEELKPGKKISKSDLTRRYAAQNAARRKKWGSKG